MIVALVAVALSWGMGWSITRRLLGREQWTPAWLRWVFELSLGWAAGTAITSVLFFVCLWLGAPAFLPPAAVLAILAFCRAPVRGQATEPTPAFEWNWVLRVGAAVTLSLALLSFKAQTDCLPDGNWDALFIWNIRAKFFAGGLDTWRLGVSDMMQGMPVGVGHPDYPALVSAFVGQAWSFDRSLDRLVPVTVSLLYLLALAGLLGGALAWLVSETIGLLAMVTLLSCDLLISWSAAQYSDVPVAFYALASLALLAGARKHDWSWKLLAFSGAMAGAACWTKDEGIALLPLLLATGLLYGGVRAVGIMAAGALPFAALTAAFKFLLAPPTQSSLPGSFSEAVKHLGEFDRWTMVASAFAQNLAAISHWWAHPALLLGAAAIVLRFLPPEQRHRQWLLLLAPLGMLAVDFGVFIITRAELPWLLRTANDRLILQVVPSLLFVFALTLQPPATLVTAPSLKETKKARHRKGK